MVPTVHPVALGWTYRIRRPARTRALVTRTDEEGAERALLDSRGRARVNWTEVARTILEDALTEAPVRKLALDYGHFLFLPQGETRAVSGDELAAWLDSWSLPSLPGELQDQGRR